MSSHDPYFKLRPPLPTPESELCVCAGGKPIKLMCALSYNPLHCIDCNLEVPPESLGLDETLAEAIAFWRSIHDALDRLWLASGEYETWARFELENIGSPVNQLGLELQQQLDRVRRCYYWFFQDESVEDFEPIRECPLCSGVLAPYGNGIFPQAICQGCRIITVGS